MKKISLSKLESFLKEQCDALRGAGLDAAEYKDYIIAMIFLKRVNDQFAIAQQEHLKSLRQKYPDLTEEELQAEIMKTQTEMDAMTNERTHVTYAMRRATPERKAELQAQKAELTKQITPLRKKLKLMRDIERRSAHIDETLTRVYEGEECALTPNIEDKNKDHKERTYER